MFENEHTFADEYISSALAWLEQRPSNKMTLTGVTSADKRVYYEGKTYF
jgi:hypothetical protein